MNSKTNGEWICYNAVMRRDRKLQLFSTLIALLFAVQLSAQEGQPEPVASFDLGEIVVFKDYQFSSEKEEKKYHQLENDLDLVYPLLVLMRSEYERVNKELALYQGEDREKKFLKWYENYAKETYIHKLAVLNSRQGRLFLKLISRELNITPFELIKEYRNGFRATVWQVAANFYFANLKVEYNPDENPMIEHIMKKKDAEYKANNVNGDIEDSSKVLSENIMPTH